MRIPWKVASVTLSAILIAGSVAAQETPTPEPLTPVQLQAVQAFEADGILEGTSSCSVEDCSGTVQRWEVAMWIIRLFNYQPTPHETFADVDSEQPYAGFVETLFDEDITVGCLLDPLRFCPERPTSRGQMAAFITRAYDLDDTDPPHGYSDVSPTNVFRDNISALKNTGILTSDCSEGEGLFCPHSPIDVAEAVEWLYAASLLEGTEDQEDGTDDGETDDGDTGRGNGGDTGRGNGGGNGGGGNGGGNGGGGNGGGNGGGGNGGGNGGGGNGGGGNGGGDGGGPGGVEFDIGPNGECSHWEVHSDSGGAVGKSHVLLAEDLPLDDGRTLGAGLYAHRHDDDGLKWWYWEPGSDRAPASLFEGDPRIPCHHAECPDHDHGPDGTDSADYVAAEGNPQAKTYMHTHTDSMNLVEDTAAWLIGDVTPINPPCSHES